MGQTLRSPKSGEERPEKPSSGLPAPPHKLPVLPQPGRVLAEVLINSQWVRTLGQLCAQLLYDKHGWGPTRGGGSPLSPCCSPGWGSGCGDAPAQEAEGTPVAASVSPSGPGRAGTGRHGAVGVVTWHDVNGHQEPRSQRQTSSQFNTQDSADAKCGGCQA